MAKRMLNDGDRVVCIGDSITADPEGYVTMARQVIDLAYPEGGIEIINAGAGGNTTAEMLARFRDDVLSAKPTWVTISAGANDALHAVPLPDYDDTMSEMILLAEEAGIKVGLCTPTRIEPSYIGADPDRLNDQIERYAEWCAQTADEQDLLLIPMYELTELVHDASEPGDEVWLTSDGVHMSPTGRYLMGLTFLAAFGFSLPRGSEAAP